MNLGGAVARIASEPHESQDRGDVDDAPTSILRHEGNRGTRHVDTSEVVDPHVTIEVLDIGLQGEAESKNIVRTNLHESLRPRHTGVIHQDIEPPFICATGVAHSFLSGVPV